MMNRNRYLPLLALFIVILLVAPIFSPNSSGLPELKRKKPVIKVAFIWQRWDTLDYVAPICMKIYKHHLKKAESKYDVNFKVYTFWDNRLTGDVQRGMLRKLDIDVVVGPGGFGGLNSPEKYRKEIKKFVRRGGGFYGICGDSTFGSLGVINFPRGYKLLLNKLLGFKELTPMLGLANVYSDASSFDREFDHPLLYGKLDLTKSVSSLFLSRVPVRIVRSDSIIQKPYHMDNVYITLGNVPLVAGPKINRLFMSKVIDIAIFKGSGGPYDKSLRGKKAIIATTYKKGRVILSAPHPEFTVVNKKAHDIFARNILWCAKELHNTNEIFPRFLNKI